MSSNFTQIKCPTCGRRLRVRGRFPLDKKVRCPACQAPIQFQVQASTGPPGQSDHSPWTRYVRSRWLIAAALAMAGLVGGVLMVPQFRAWQAHPEASPTVSKAPQGLRSALGSRPQSTLPSSQGLLVSAKQPTTQPNSSPPLAVPDVFQIVVGDRLEIDAPGVLGGENPDHSFNGADLTVADHGNPEHGTAVIDPTGALTYVPDPGFIGTDRFTYSVTDGQLESDPARITVVVMPKSGNSSGNAQLVGMPDVYETNQDTPLYVPAPGVIGGQFPDLGPADAALSVEVATAPTSGEVSLQSDGSFNYVPAPGFSGQIEFSYFLKDGNNQSEPVLVSIVVVATQPLAFATGPLPNGPGTSSSITGVNPATFGSGAGPTPGQPWPGPQPYPPLPSGPQPPQPLGNNRPVAVNDAYEVQQDSALKIPAPGVMVGPMPDFDLDRSAIWVEPSQGTTVNGAIYSLAMDGSFTFVPKQGFKGVDQVFYRVTDSQSLSDFASITVLVRPKSTNPPSTNLAPIAVPDSFLIELNKDGRFVVAAPGILNSGLPDMDPNGDSISVVKVDKEPGHGKLSLFQDGGFEYTPTQTPPQDDVFSYVITDGMLLSSPATVTLKYVPSNGNQGGGQNGNQGGSQGNNQGGGQGGNQGGSQGGGQSTSEWVHLKSYPKDWTHYQQPDDSSCGPSSTRMVLAYHGMKRTFVAVQAACNSGIPRDNVPKDFKYLTIPSGIEAGLEHYKVPATIQTRRNLQDLARLIDEDRAPIILIRTGKEYWHYVVVVGYRKDLAEFKLSDPGDSDAEKVYAADIVEAAWSSEGDLKGHDFSVDCVSPFCKDGKVHCIHCGGRGQMVETEEVKEWSPEQFKWIFEKVEKTTRCVRCDGHGFQPCPLCGDIFRFFVFQFTEPRTLIAPDESPGRVVPRFVDDVVVTAKRKLGELELVPEWVGEIGNSEITKVIDQDPPPGTRVALGSTVRLTLGELVNLPTVSNLTVTEAMQLLQSNKLKTKVGIRDFLADDIVARIRLEGDSPAPGMALAGSTIVITEVKRRTPNVVGQPVQEAATTIAKSKLRVNLPPGFTDNATVLTQQPEAGELIRPGGSIQVTLGVAVPFLVQSSFEEAQQAIDTAGLRLKPTVVDEVLTEDPLRAGAVTVVGQEPPTGTIVRMGSQVAVQVVRQIPGTRVPNVVQIELGEARRGLATIGLNSQFQITGILPTQDPRLAGQVLVSAQSQAPGTLLPAGSTLLLQAVRFQYVPPLEGNQPQFPNEGFPSGQNDHVGGGSGQGFF